MSVGIYEGADKENEPAKDRKLAGVGGRRPSSRASGVKRDFFGRVIKNEEGRNTSPSGEGTGGLSKKAGNKGRTWVVYHEGHSNAVRKQISLKDLMSGL